MLETNSMHFAYGDVFETRGAVSGRYWLDAGIEDLRLDLAVELEEASAWGWGFKSSTVKVAGTIGDRLEVSAEALALVEHEELLLESVEGSVSGILPDGEVKVAAGATAQLVYDEVLLMKDGVPLEPGSPVEDIVHGVEPVENPTR